MAAERKEIGVILKKKICMCSNLRNKNVKNVLTNTILLILQLKSLLQQQFFLRHPVTTFQPTCTTCSQELLDTAIESVAKFSLFYKQLLLQYLRERNFCEIGR
ncbi:hypothetical protein ES703_07299 [subsurface metagenome]